MFQIPLIYKELSLNSLLAIYTKLELENPFQFYTKQMEKHLIRDIDEKTKIHCLTYARGTGKTIFRIILAILAAQNKFSVGYIIKGKILKNNVEEEIKEICTKLDLNYSEINKYISIKDEIQKGSSLDIIIDDTI